MFETNVEKKQDKKSLCSSLIFIYYHLRICNNLQQMDAPDTGHLKRSSHTKNYHDVADEDGEQAESVVDDLYPWPGL